MRICLSGCAVVVSVTGLLLGPHPASAQAAQPAEPVESGNAEQGVGDWTTPRTAWGAPDLQGVWDYRTATPLERPNAFEGREFLTDDEVVAYEHRAVTRADGRPPDDPRSAPSVHAPEWLDYGKRVVDTRRTSLITLPDDGHIPPLSDEGERRVAARRTAKQRQGAADSYRVRSLWERCITRGLPTGMMPAGYNNNVQLLQTPDSVVIFNEMIHDARIVPLDGRPHVDDAIRQWRGDSRARWDGDTLVVETTNFSDDADFNGSNGNLHLVERFTRIGADAVKYEFTVTDPMTWTSPWTVTFPLTRSREPVYEYACHEGNYGLLNILSVARSTEP